MDSNKQVVNSALTASEREHKNESELTEQQDVLSLVQLLSSAALLRLRLPLLLRLLFTFVVAAATVIILLAFSLCPRMIYFWTGCDASSSGPAKLRHVVLFRFMRTLLL